MWNNLPAAVIEATSVEDFNTLIQWYSDWERFIQENRLSERFNAKMVWFRIMKV